MSVAKQHTTLCVRALVDPQLTATLTDLRPLLYADDSAMAHGIPGHVRAASAVRRWRSQMLIIQDDVNALVIHDGVNHATAICLPATANGDRAFDSERGNKHQKMDLEACAALPDGRLVAFGSGSTAARDNLVVINEDRSYRIFDAQDLYNQLRQTFDFAGSELNVEGALVVEQVLRLFQRGNGAPRAGHMPVNATGDLSLVAFVSWLDGCGPMPTMQAIVQYDLGHTDNVPFTFTDAAAFGNGRTAFLACAEASPNTVDDGEVLGCRFGMIDGGEVRTTDIRDAEGRPTRLKLEGLEAHPTLPNIFDVVVDMDSPNTPSLIGRLEIGERR